MDGTVGDVQHLIMLGVLSAQSADEPAPFAPGDPHRFHVATLPRFWGLTPKEPPSLAVRPSATLASLLHGPSAFAQGRKSLRVGPREFRQPEARGEGDRPLQVPGVPVLDDLLELAPQRRRKLH